jgi:hypothetical protein
MTDSIITVETGVLSGLIGIIAGYWLKIARETLEASRTRNHRFDALRAEIDYCARLARTFNVEGFNAPLYRFPNNVFQAVYPYLVSEVLTNSDVHALTGFYSQVDQMNRGLDAVERYRAANDPANFAKEVDRLKGKAEEMQHPETIREPGQRIDFYSGAIAVINRHRANSSGVAGDSVSQSLCKR